MSSNSGRALALSASSSISSTVATSAATAGTHGGQASRKEVKAQPAEAQLGESPGKWRRGMPAGGWGRHGGKQGRSLLGGFIYVFVCVCACMCACGCG